MIKMNMRPSLAQNDYRGILLPCRFIGLAKETSHKFLDKNIEKLVD